MLRGAEQWRRYRLFGLTMASNFSFATRLSKGTGEPDLTFTVTTKQGDLPGSWQDSEPAYTSSGRLKDGRPYLYVYGGPGFDIVRFTDVAVFYVWPEHIVCQLLDPAYNFAVEIYLLGTVLSLWFERQGISALHASAVVVKDRAVAFLASNTGGKTSLAAILMQAGYSLLTDDILLVEELGAQIAGRPGYPQMRMWPDQARHFLGHADLDRVTPHLDKCRIPVGVSDFGSFCAQSRPLSCIYVPVRANSLEEGTVEMSPLNGAEALMELIGHSFVAHIVESLGWQSRRLGLLSQVVREVPLFRLEYPNGMEHMPYVRQTILDNLARSPAQFL